MLIQFNTDNHTTGREELEGHYNEALTKSLGRFSDHITRLEVHIGDENGHKNGPMDKRCMLEARLEGMQPIAVTGHADNREQALKMAIDKLKSALDTAIGKLRNH